MELEETGFRVFRTRDGVTSKQKKVRRSSFHSPFRLCGQRKMKGGNFVHIAPCHIFGLDFAGSVMNFMYNSTIATSISALQRDTAELYQFE